MCRILNFMFLRCPFNLLRIFKDGVHQSKTEFLLGPGSGANFVSDTGLFVNLQDTNIHPLHSQFSNHPSSGAKFAPESESTHVFALFNKQTSCSEASLFQRSHSCLQISVWSKTGVQKRHYNYSIFCLMYTDMVERHALF